MATTDQNAFRRACRIAYRAATNWIRMTPDFIIIGTQKGGTTSLYHYLIEHPSISPIYVKEPHFFDIFYSNGFSWYRAHFPSLAQKYYAQSVKKQPFIAGEASPYYLFHPLALNVSPTLCRVPNLLCYCAILLIVPIRNTSINCGSRGLNRSLLRKLSTVRRNVSLVRKRKCCGTASTSASVIVTTAISVEVSISIKCRDG